MKFNTTNFLLTVFCICFVLFLPSCCRIADCRDCEECVLTIYGTRCEEGPDCSGNSPTVEIPEVKAAIYPGNDCSTIINFYGEHVFTEYQGEGEWLIGGYDIASDREIGVFLSLPIEDGLPQFYTKFYYDPDDENGEFNDQYSFFPFYELPGFESEVVVHTLVFNADNTEITDLHIEFREIPMILSSFDPPLSDTLCVWLELIK